MPEYRRASNIIGQQGDSRVGEPKNKNKNKPVSIVSHDGGLYVVDGNNRVNQLRSHDEPRDHDVILITA